jgi:sulfur-carrier protein
MAMVTLRAPLRDLAGGTSRLEVPGATVAEVIGRLEREHPRLAGWVLDERGRIREHVKVFVNGDVAGLEDSVAAGDQVHVLPAISGGRD